MAKHEQKCTFLPVSLSNCSPNEITGIADAKNIYVVGAKILQGQHQNYLKVIPAEYEVLQCLS